MTEEAPVRRTRGRPPRPEATQERRKQLLAAAIEVFGHLGYHQATMQQVAARTGISVGLIYQYFDDKEALLFAVINEILDSYLRELPRALAAETDPLARLRAVVHAYCRVVDEHRSAALVGYREYRALSRARMRQVVAKEREATALIGDAVEACRASGQLDVADPELFTYHIVVFVHSWALNAWRFTPPIGRDAYVERGLALLIDPARRAVAWPARRRKA